MLMATAPIGVYDSGVGGLSVLKALLTQLPNETFHFVADEAYLPYGDKPQHAITERVLRLASCLYQQGCKALVIACNTATAAGATQTRLVYPNWPIVGIEPAVKPASMMTKTGVVGILATTNTVASERFRGLVERFDPLAKVLAKPCPGLVELIERVPLDRTAVIAHLKPVVDEFLAAHVDVIVLGCTHYPFVVDVVAELAGPGVSVIETGGPVARQLQHVVTAEGLARSDVLGLSDLERVKFFTTGSPKHFVRKVESLLGPAWQGVQVQVACL